MRSHTKCLELFYLMTHHPMNLTINLLSVSLTKLSNFTIAWIWTKIPQIDLNIFRMKNLIGCTGTHIPRSDMETCHGKSYIYHSKLHWVKVDQCLANVYIASPMMAQCCKLDPMSSSFHKILIDVLLPILTHIIKLSFIDGPLPLYKWIWKRALIIPLLKKFCLDPDVFKKFQLISNVLNPSHWWWELIMWLPDQEKHLAHSWFNHRTIFL